MARKRAIDIRHPELTDESWARLAPHLPEPVASPDGGPMPLFGISHAAAVAVGIGHIVCNRSGRVPVDELRSGTWRT